MTRRIFLFVWPSVLLALVLSATYRTGHERGFEAGQKAPVVDLNINGDAGDLVSGGGGLYGPALGAIYAEGVITSDSADGFVMCGYKDAKGDAQPLTEDVLRSTRPARNLKPAGPDYAPGAFLENVPYLELPADYDLTVISGEAYEGTAMLTVAPDGALVVEFDHHAPEPGR